MNLPLVVRALARREAQYRLTPALPTWGPAPRGAGRLRGRQDARAAPSFGLTPVRLGKTLRGDAGVIRRASVDLVDSLTHLHLIRHGEVEERYHKVFGGRVDMSLSAHGHDQAAALARYLEGTTYDAIYVSPMQRAQLTLAPLATRFTGAPVTLPGLREVDFGNWTGLRWDEVKDRFGVSAFDWLDQMINGGFPDGENAEDFRTRVKAALDEILEEQRGCTVAVVCHGGVVRMLLSLLLDLPLGKFAHFEIDYASLTWVTVGERRGWRPRNEVQLLNFTPWRDLA